MTGYTVHTGSNEKFRDGWDKVFGAKPKQTKQVADKAPQGAEPAKPEKPTKSAKAKKT